MLDFLSIRVPDQFSSQWARVHLTAERILLANPTILNYWVHIHRNGFYHRFFRSKNIIVNNDCIHSLTSDNDISVDDIDLIYQFIRTSIHVVLTNDNCSSSYYAQTKQNENNKETTIISLSDRLFQSDVDAFVFVAAAVLLREISRAIWPECLKNTRSTQFLQNPAFYSWTGAPVKLWPDTKKAREVISREPLAKYVTHPSSGKSSLVADAGNLFQHLFYNGEVHLYDDEVDDRDNQIIVHAVLRVHQTQASLCAGRYLSDKTLHDFFNINNYSLEVIRLINDQPCPYFRYCPIENRSTRVLEIVVDNRPLDQRTDKHYRFTFTQHGLFYGYKPYDLNEPRQHYEQTIFLGYPSSVSSGTCIQLYEHVIEMNDSFFLENRWLFRRKAPSLTRSPLSESEMKAYLERVVS